MAFAAPISFFESISIMFGGAGLIFEGLTNRGGCGHEKFCQGLPGVNPQRSNQSVLPRNLFLGDALSERDRDRTGMKALSRVPWALRLHVELGRTQRNVINRSSSSDADTHAYSSTKSCQRRERVSSRSSTVSNLETGA